MPIVSINDYDTYNASPSPNHAFSRQCPNMRTCFPTLSRSFNPVTADRPLMARRIAFLITLFFRATHSFFLTIYYLPSIWTIPVTAINVLFFFFIAWNLHLIVEAVGERMVMGRKFGRGAFDAALASFMVVHVLVVASDLFLGLGGWSSTWSTTDLLILGVAWVSTWDPEDGGLTLA
jgi:hypothetical protein